MSVQIAVRLPENLVEFIDDLVAHGDHRSRAAVVSSALEREWRRAMATRDAEILSRQIESEDDLAGLAKFIVDNPPPVE